MLFQQASHDNVKYERKREGVRAIDRVKTLNWKKTNEYGPIPTLPGTTEGKLEEDEKKKRTVTKRSTEYEVRSRIELKEKRTKEFNMTWLSSALHGS